MRECGLVSCGNQKLMVCVLMTLSSHSPDALLPKKQATDDADPRLLFVSLMSQ